MHFSRTLLTDDRLHTPRLKSWIQRLTVLCEHRRFIWLLVFAGVVRAVLLLLAYPPAHQSDSDLFFLYAERMYAYPEWSLLDSVTYPAYPFLILITYKWLGSAYWLIALQFLMSITIAPLYYGALKPYSPILAATVSIVLLLDVQAGTSFNFANAEPLYIFLLALTFNVILRQIAPGAKAQWSLRDSFVGILMVLLWLTRTIGRYLIIPYAIIFFLYTRDWKRTLTMLGGFVVALLVYSLLSQIFLGQVAGLNATDYAFARVMRHHPDWVLAENGPNSQIWLEATANCDPPEQFHQAYCIYERYGDWGKTESVIRGAAIETILPNLWEYGLEVWRGVEYFLASSAEIYNQTEELPSTVQCETGEEKVEAMDMDFARTIFSRMHIPLLGHETDAELVSALAEYREVMLGINLAFCPPTPDVPVINQAVDWLMERNRSFGRPNPYLWYGAVLLLALVIPWARRLLPVVLLMGLTLAMLALSPAMLSVFTNPRYVLPANALRITLIATLIFILLKLGILLLDRLLKRRSAR